MSVLVVIAFEVIGIDKEHGQAAVIPLQPIPFVFQCNVQCATVLQPGERVGLRQLPQVAFGHHPPAQRKSQEPYPCAECETHGQRRQPYDP